MMESSGAERMDSGNVTSGSRAVRHGAAWTMLLAGAVLFMLIGTWLVWFSFMVQHRHNEEDIRAACQRVMPETVERCVDTVIIQRGGLRR